MQEEHIINAQTTQEQTPSQPAAVGRGRGRFANKKKQERGKKESNARKQASLKKHGML